MRWFTSESASGWPFKGKMFVCRLICSDLSAKIPLKNMMLFCYVLFAWFRW